MDEAKPFGTYAPTGFVRWAVETTRSFPDSWLARRAVIAIRRIVVSRLRGAPVDIEALGARMRVRPYNNVCEKRMLFTPQSFDPRELEILASRLRDGFTFIDIGANVGAYSLFVASRAGSSAQVLAIEPQPAIFDRLVHNIRLNAFANIKAIACAIADKAGEVTLFIDARNSGESSVKIVAAEGAEPIRVPAKTLLDLVREEGFTRIDAIKLDVEGAEDIVLGPFLGEAPETLLPSLLIIEDGVRQWQIDLPALLRRHGYREIAKTRLNLVYERIAGASLPAGTSA
ncbi:FkbM family methyltransferase [uncultured Enterovirga sp.]|uniref:FkbM family methyltransferase n=1 Tax=uncultured Enterovirga sp. TaxID=2026352 RepID=UPI0035CB99C7